MFVFKEKVSLLIHKNTFYEFWIFFEFLTITECYQKYLKIQKAPRKSSSLRITSIPSPHDHKMWQSLLFFIISAVFYNIFYIRYFSHVPLFIHILTFCGAHDDVLMWNIFTGGSYIMRLSARTTNNKLPPAGSLYCCNVVML